MGHRTRNHIFSERTRHWSGIVLFSLMFSICFVVALSLVGARALFVFLERERPPATETAPLTFPLGVDPYTKEIQENPDLEHYYERHIASRQFAFIDRHTWFSEALSALTLRGWFQNLASASSRILVIQPGERKEQVAQNFGKILRWDRAERDTFLDAITSATPVLEEGKFFPGTYVVSRNASPEDVALLVVERFNNEFLIRYTNEVAQFVPLSEALIIASLLEREAYDFEDMRLIAGVIWNRLFIDMRLQIDATLQYAKGSRIDQPWWPRVLPQDKYISSPFNTYAHEGLPPNPIANPSLAATLAALNPRKTDCLFYFHNADGDFYCSPTYEGHVDLLRQEYGSGR